MITVGEIRKVIVENLKRICAEKNVKQVEIAEHLGVSQGSVSNWFKGTNSIDIENLAKLCEFLGVSLDQMYGAEPQKTAGIPNLPNILPITTRRIPILGSIACGEPLMTDAPFEAYVELGTDVGADYALRAVGDSMTGARIQDGDIVFIRSQPTVDDGEIAAVLIDGEATLKRVRHAGTDLVLWPENPAYQPIIVPAGSAKDIRVLGKAVAFQSDVR